MDPIVTFVVPCYKLGHLLKACVDSILEQTFTELEVLIMDDCSPDQTPEVAQSFSDARVKHIRNEVNLGHLRNYNKGIAMARGKYIWLISADDRLRRPYVLERYVALMEQHPEVGYVFCPGMDLVEGEETGVLQYSVHGDRDTIFKGAEFLEKLVFANTIVAPSGMVRRECYDITMFPLDMPWAGDWYLWCIFAFHYDVGYFAEPMVCYRRHTVSMTGQLMNGNLRDCSRQDVVMPWLMKQKAEARGYRALIAPCLLSAAREYARSVATRRYRTSQRFMTLEEFEQSLAENTSDPAERAFVRRNMFVAAADLYVWQEEYALARSFYLRSLRESPWLLRSWLRFFVLSLGNVGIRLRKAFLAIRRTRTQHASGG